MLIPAPQTAPTSEPKNEERRIGHATFRDALPVHAAGSTTSINRLADGVVVLGITITQFPGITPVVKLASPEETTTLLVFPVS